MRAVLCGAGMLLHWETYVAVAAYFLVASGPFLLPSVRAGHGIASCPWWFRFGLKPLAMAVAMVGLVGWLFPLITGTGTSVSWGFPLALAVRHPLQIAVVIALMLVAVAVARMFGRSYPGDEALPVGVLGVVATAFLALSLFGKDVSVLPGFWLFLGGAAGCWLWHFLAMLAGCLLADRINRRWSWFHAEFKPLWIWLVSSLIGLAPVFVYGAWLGLQVKPV